MNKLKNKITDYVEKTKKLYLPYICKEWGVSPKDFTETLCGLWDSFPNPRVEDNLINIDVEQEPNFYEVSSWYNRGNYIHKDSIKNYCYYNNRPNQHVSVYTHDRRWIENYNKTGSVSCSQSIVGCETFYLELDRPSLQEAIDDAKKIYNNSSFKEYMRFWYSGNNSIHIEVDATLFGRPMGSQHKIAGYNKLVYNLAHKLAGDVRNDVGVVNPHSYTGEELKRLHKQVFGERPDHMEKHILRQKFETIDPNVFGVNSLIRQPYSIHQKNDMMKCALAPDELDKAGREKIEKKCYKFNNTQPKLLHWIYDCYVESTPPSYEDIDVDSEEVLDLFSKVFRYFDPNEANSQGWVNGLYNPLYEDTKPSVGVNILTGHIKDFGAPSYSMGFDKFKQKIKEL